MDTKERDLKHISFLLGSWITAIRLQNAVNYFDINRISQGFSQKLLNLIYGYELEDLDGVKNNYPGLDLGELKNSGVGFQVTSRTDTAKIISSLEKVISHNLHNTFKKGIKFLILREGEMIKFGKKTDPTKLLNTFDPEKDILYPEDITVKIGKIYDADDLVTILKIKELVEKHIKPNLLGTDDGSNEKVAALYEALEKKLENLQGTIERQKVDTALIRRDETRFPGIKTRSERSDLVADYIQLLAQAPVLWICGLNNTGKTSIAYLIGKNLNLEKLWIDFRGIENERLLNYLLTSICNRLKLSVGDDFEILTDKIVGSFNSQTLLIINDLPQFNSIPERDRRDLVFFIDELTSNGFLIIVTSNHTVPADLSDQIANKIQFRDIPMFSESETIEVIRSYGAPDILQEEIAELIRTVSDGHPLITNAISKFLQERNWKLSDDNLTKIFKGDYNQAINQQTNQRLLKSTADEDSIELLYRLKEVSGNISERAINAVSAVEPQIKHPHLKVVSLAEIWLQPIENNIYQLSPLIKALPSNLKTQTKKDINISLANALLSNGAVTSQEAFNAISYFIKGDGYTDAALTLVSVLQQYLNTPDLFLTSGFNLIWFTSSIPVQVPLPLRFFIRFLQIQLCIASKRDFDFQYKDLENLKESKDMDNLTLGLYHYISYIAKLTSSSTHAATHLLEAERVMPEVMSYVGKKDELSFNNAFLLTFGGLSSLEDYQNWFNTFSSRGFDQSFYDPQTNFAYISTGLSLAIKISSYEQNIGTEETFKILQYILETALNKKLDLVATYAIKCMVAIFASQNRFDDAKNLINSYDFLLARHQIYNALIQGELGHQFYLSDKKEEAISILEQVTNINIPDFYTEKIEFLKDYARLTDDFQLAKKLIYDSLQAVLNAPDYYTPYEKLALYGELSISYLNLKEYEESINTLEKGYDVLHRTFEDNNEYRSLVIRYGHVANYVAQFVINEHPFIDGFRDYVIPRQGFFYFTNEKLIESGFYFEERRYLGAILFKSAYEYIGNYEIARKWAIESLQVVVNVPDPKFASILNTCLFYLIKDREFGKAVNIYLFIKSIRTSEIENNVLNDLGKPVSTEISVDDIVFYQNILIPMLYVLCLDLLKKAITEKQLYTTLNQVLSHQGLTFNDPSTLDFIRSFFEKALLKNTPVNELYWGLDEYNGEYKGDIYTIGYLVLSTLSSATDAAAMQLSIIQRVQNFCKHPFMGYYIFLVFPFYEEFWKEKFNQNKDEFIDHSEWINKGVPYFSNAKSKQKFQKLFRTLVYHLKLTVSTTIEEWLSI